MRGGCGCCMRGGCEACDSAMRINAATAARFWVDGFSTTCWLMLIALCRVLHSLRSLRLERSWVPTGFEHARKRLFTSEKMCKAHGQGLHEVQYPWNSWGQTASWRRVRSLQHQTMQYLAQHVATVIAPFKRLQRFQALLEHSTLHCGGTSMSLCATNYR